MYIGVYKVYIAEYERYMGLVKVCIGVYKVYIAEYEEYIGLFKVYISAIYHVFYGFTGVITHAGF